MSTNPDYPTEPFDLPIAKYEFITPEIAQRYLETQPELRRTLKLPALKRYIADMSRGAWKVTHQGIAFDKMGRLRDGQHRLTAIVRSGRGQWVLVVRNVDEAAFDAVDFGKSRTPGDVLKIHGFDNAEDRASALGWIYRYDNNFITDLSARAPNDQLVDFATEYDEITETGFFHLAQKFRPAQPAVTRALTYLFIQADPEMGKHFAERFIEGTNLTKTDNIYKLRMRLERERESATANTISPIIVAAYMIKTWNAEMEGKELQILRWVSPEPFPKIHGRSPRPWTGLRNTETEA